MIKLMLPLASVNLALDALGKMPYEDVFELVAEIHRQAQPQMKQPQIIEMDEFPAEQKAEPQPEAPPSAA